MTTIQGAPREPVRCHRCAHDQFHLTYSVTRVKGSNYLNTATPRSMTCGKCGQVAPAEDMPGYDKDIIMGTGQRSSVPPTKDGR